jgi:hypothetical protein
VALLLLVSLLIQVVNILILWVTSFLFSIDILLTNFSKMKDERNWHNDVDVRGNGCDPNQIEDISKQLIRSDVGSRLQVILGGGRANMRNNTILDEEGVRGRRTDGLDLIQEYLDRNADSRVKYVWDAVILLL